MLHPNLETRSFIISKKQELYDQLLNSIEGRFDPEAEAQRLPLWDWAEKTPVILDGRPFSFQRHEYLRVPYQDNHPYQVEMKAAQMGLPESSPEDGLWRQVRKLPGHPYLFPSKADVTDFSKGRIDPLIDENPETIGKWIRDTDAANIKRVWNSFLYFRGMKSRVGLKSIPVDFDDF